jgi:hypothetical protein
LILCTLMYLTISPPSINLSISKLFRILHILSILTLPNIFLNICLSEMRRLFPSFVVKSQSLFSDNLFTYSRALTRGTDGQTETAKTRGTLRKLSLPMRQNFQVLQFRHKGIQTQ